jgi:hypothetical protein
MKTKILSIMIFGLFFGSKSFASGPITFTFPMIQCSTPAYSQICVQPVCVCHDVCCPDDPECGGYLGPYCCLVVPPGSTSISFDGTNACGEIDFPPTPDNNCTNYTVWLVSGCDNEVTDIYNISFDGTNWKTTLVSGGTHDGSTPDLSLTYTGTNTFGVAPTCICTDNQGSTVGF